MKRVLRILKIGANLLSRWGLILHINASGEEQNRRETDGSCPPRCHSGIRATRISISLRRYQYGGTLQYVDILVEPVSPGESLVRWLRRAQPSPRGRTYCPQPQQTWCRRSTTSPTLARFHPQTCRSVSLGVPGGCFDASDGRCGTASQSFARHTKISKLVRGAPS